MLRALGSVGSAPCSSPETAWAAHARPSVNAVAPTHRQWATISRLAPAGCVIDSLRALDKQPRSGSCSSLIASPSSSVVQVLKVAFPRLVLLTALTARTSEIDAIRLVSELHRRRRVTAAAIALARLPVRVAKAERLVLLSCE